MKLIVKVDPMSGIDTGTKAVQRAVQDAKERVVMDAALLIETEAKLLAPVRTGTLRRSIHREVVESTAVRTVVKVGPDELVTYAGFVEMGTSRMKAQPYMRPAYETQKGAVVDSITSELRPAITEALVDITNQIAARRAARRSSRGG